MIFITLHMFVVFCIISFDKNIVILLPNFE